MKLWLFFAAWWVPVLAAEARAPLSLRWTAPEECPAQSQLEQRIGAELREVHAPVLARVEVVRVEDQYSAEVWLNHGRVRRVVARTCEQLTQAVSVVILLAATESTARPAPVTSVLNEPAAAPQSVKRERYALGPLMALDSGLAEKLRSSAGLTAAIREPNWRVEANVRWWVPVQADDWSGFSPLVSGQLRACSGTESGWCAAAEGGLTGPAVPEWLTEEQRVQSFWVALFAGGSVPVLRNDSTLLRGTLEMGTALVQPRYGSPRTANGVEMYVPLSVIIRASLGVEFGLQ